MTVADVSVEGDHGIFEGGDLDTWDAEVRGGGGAGGGRIKVNLTPSCNHKLVSQLPLDDIRL